MLFIIKALWFLLVNGVTSSCISQLQVDQCAQTTLESRLSNCGPSDNKCQCDGYVYLLACYQPCGSSGDDYQKYDGFKTNYCSAASLTPITSTFTPGSTGVLSATTSKSVIMSSGNPSIYNSVSSGDAYNYQPIWFMGSTISILIITSLV